ncbi:M48 family metallopeptidase [Cyanobium sp. ATX 6F1]|uniref:M48 family metallopeptidase n=1 Tax=unclassified Cyanobium TaxID=2627006 RepID=UPI0020CF0667|nr:M48 family metallopeptidase [Cyanobium sp. ATX 6F1]MCP9915897.1 M48 family metallopeptidase [Cyanobium sp. ATX 6F1]
MTSERHVPLRTVLLVLLLAGGAGLIALLMQARPGSPLTSSLATPFQLLGTPLKLADRLASRGMPIGSLEERDLGDTFRERYAYQVKVSDPDQAYLDALMPLIRSHARKPFPYRAYVIPSESANAMALPGGVILVNRGLLNTLGSEAELVSVLAHEAGHIELGHCFDTVRFQLLARKRGSETLGQLADLALGILVQHNYSKAAEHEADVYAFTLLRYSPYDPRGSGASFASLERSEGSQSSRADDHADLLRDYISSHPPLAIRQAEFSQAAEAWWRGHPAERRYWGRRNLRGRRALSALDLGAEWHGARLTPPAPQATR